MEIIRGIHQLKVPIPNNPLGYVLPYLIEGEDGFTLLDCGWNTPEAWEALERQLKELGVAWHNVKRLLLTHVHPDHYGLAGRVKEASGAEVVMHARERDFIHSRYEEPELLLAEMAAWLQMHGVPENEVGHLKNASMPARQFVTSTLPDRVVYGGETFSTGEFELEVIWTPGHSPGHICLYERRHKLLMTGDHVLPTISPNVSLHPQQLGNPLADFIEGIRRLKALDVDTALPAHEFTFEHLQRRLNELEQHHQARLQEMLDAIGEGELTAYQVAAHVQWVTGKFETFSLWMKRAALGETLAHLEYLHREGVLRRSHRNGVVYFARV